MSYNSKNYHGQGGAVFHVGGKIVFDNGLMENMSTAAVASDSVAKVRSSLDALITNLKNAGLMVGDAFNLTVTKNVTDNVAGHADRQDNTSHISSVAESDGVITITLDRKVSELKDFDGGNGWGVHKWLGIGISAGLSPITSLTYNDAVLTSEDVDEASSCGLGAGYFVRWVAADLVLAGDNTQKSTDTFKLWASGYTETAYKLKIVEPSV